MAIELTPTGILNIASICQVLAITDRGFNNAMKGGQLDERLPIMLYNERKAVEWVNNTNPSDPTLQGMANYLYALCYPYVSKAQQIINGISGGLPLITGPSNQSGNVDFNAVFSVSVVSATSVTYQWFRNSVAIPGAISSSYTLSNAQLADSGATFFVVATNAAGQTVSSTANLTVTNAILGFLYYTSTDPGPTLISNSDPFSYQSNYPITHNSPISIPISVAAANNQFLVAKVPSTESAKGTWFSTVLNNGVIPDFVFAAAVTFGGFTYYYTKQSISLDPTQPLVLS